MKNFNKITHVIYDLDGLLLATESFHEQVNQEIARRYGKVFDKSIKAKVAGRSTWESAQLLINLLELPLTPQTYLEQRNQLIYPLYPQSQPLPGAMRLTHHLSQQGIPQSIATSSPRRHFQMKTTHHQDWLSLFDCFVLGDDPALQRSKPAPDIFLLAAQRMGTPPENCLVFEDSLAGVEAALAGGMSVVAIPDLDLDRQLYENAHQILDSLADFEPEVWNLPGFEAKSP